MGNISFCTWRIVKAKRVCKEKFSIWGQDWDLVWWGCYFPQQIILSFLWVLCSVLAQRTDLLKLLSIHHRWQPCNFVKSNICSGRNCVYMYKQVSKTCISEKRKHICSNISKNYQPIQHNLVTQSNLPGERKRLCGDVQTPSWHQMILLLYRSTPLWFCCLIKGTSCQWQVQFFKTNLYAGLSSDFNQQSLTSLSLLIQASCELDDCVQNCPASSGFTGQFDRDVRSMKFCWLRCLAQLWWK